MVELSSRRLLGRSGIWVSPLCLGTMMFGGPTDECEARRIIDDAAGRGINFIDTANTYADGRSEEIVGPAVKANRAGWIIATKVGQVNAPRDGRARNLSRPAIMSNIDQSLQRLRLDHVDIYYAHIPDALTPWEDVVETFGLLIASGRILHWGLSNVRSWEIAHIVHLCRQMNVSAPIVLQPYYNAFNRQPEVDVLPAAHHFGLGVVPYSPLARGVLSGKYLSADQPDPGSRAGRGDERMLQSEWRPQSVEIAKTIKRHAEAKGGTIIGFALAWLFNNGAITSPIAGPRTKEQWETYCASLDYPWDEEDEALLDSLVAIGHPSTPGYSDPMYPIDGRFPIIRAGS